MPLSEMKRLIARLPDGVTELCLLRLGLQARGWRALWYAAGLGRAIDRASAEAIRTDAGLLHSERFNLGPRHFGVLHYWRSFEAMEAWTRRPPHADWWRVAVERMRRRADFGIYHETYLIPRDRIESIYLDCDPVGLARFGTTSDPVGPDTNSRGRLGLGPLRSGG